MEVFQIASDIGKLTIFNFQKEWLRGHASGIWFKQERWLRANQKKVSALMFH